MAKPFLSIERLTQQYPDGAGGTLDATEGAEVEVLERGLVNGLDHPRGLPRHRTLEQGVDAELGGFRIEPLPGVPGGAGPAADGRPVPLLPRGAEGLRDRGRLVPAGARTGPADPERPRRLGRAALQEPPRDPGRSAGHAGVFQLDRVAVDALGLNHISGPIYG